MVPQRASDYSSVKLILFAFALRSSNHYICSVFGAPWRPDHYICSARGLHAAQTIIIILFGNSSGGRFAFLCAGSEGPRGAQDGPGERPAGRHGSCGITLLLLFYMVFMMSVYKASWLIALALERVRIGRCVKQKKNAL